MSYSAGTPNGDPGTPNGEAPSPLQLRPGLLAAGAALVVNLGLYFIATGVGYQPWVVWRMTAFIGISWWIVAFMSIVPTIVGTVITMMVAGRSRQTVARMARIGLIAAIGTMVFPLVMGLGIPSKITLAAMHLVCGVLWWAALRVAVPTSN